MADYLHGAYGQIQATGSRVSAESKNAIVYIGTAPVHTVEGGAKHVNRPVLAFNMAEARKKLGYSEDFASYTLCEAMKAHFEQNGVGPLVFINVLDPGKHVSDTQGSKNLTPENGRVTIVAADKIILDSVEVKSGEDAKEKGKDYAIAYNVDKQTITIAEVKPGSLGTAALTISYQEVDPAAVTPEDVIGETDGCGLNTGVYVINNVLQETGYIPSFLVFPGFSNIPAIHSAVANNSTHINGHYNGYMFTDIPIVDGSEEVTLETAAEWKRVNGYTNENETTHFPMVKGKDGNHHHLSTQRAANFQALLVGQSGAPYRTASNTECPIIDNLYLGEGYEGRVFDDTIINEKLCKNGIASAAFVGGKWVHWGAHCADYSQETENSMNVAETNRMMLYYVTNDFQYRRSLDVDKPMTMNDIQSIAADEQRRLDALIETGALIYGKVTVNATEDAMSDAILGDFSFVFEVTTTPLVKSLTAIVNWTEKGYETYFEPLTGK